MTPPTTRELAERMVSAAASDGSYEACVALAEREIAALTAERDRLQELAASVDDRIEMEYAKHVHAWRYTDGTYEESEAKLKADIAAWHARYDPIIEQAKASLGGEEGK